MHSERLVGYELYDYRTGIKISCNTILPNTLLNKLYTYSRLSMFVKLQMAAINQRKTIYCASIIFKGATLCNARLQHIC